MQPNPAQLVTIALYALAIAGWMILIWREAKIGKDNPTNSSSEIQASPSVEVRGSQRSRAWLAMGLAVLVLLALDRYFWFNHLIADQIRELAHHQGWYHRRRKLQVVVMACTVALLVPISLFLRRAQRSQTLGRSSASNLILCMLVAFCFVRALSNHYVDRVLVYPLQGFRVHWLLEWTLLMALIASLGFDAASLRQRNPMNCSK